MNKRLSIVILVVLALSLGFCESHKSAAQEPALPAAAVVVNAVENMHSAAADTSDVVSQAILGMNVKVLASERNSSGESWYQIETPDTYKGWILSSAVRALGGGEAAYASSGTVFVVSALLANTYLEASVTKHKPVKTAPISAVLEVVTVQDARWIEVKLPDGSQAWIQAGDGAQRQGPWAWPRTTAEEMVAQAKRFIGLPYTWGGTSPLGVDCSGLVQLIYKMGGVSILRDAGIQMTDSGLLDVPKGTEQAGDLVFFGSAIDKIGHVGMMIDSEYFINATVHEKPVVQISRLKDPFWQAIYQGARRAKQ
jgi:cell wall-associated NlpC family hydrolase